MSKDTIIISAFPACGKTWCVENLKDKLQDAKIHTDIFGSDHCPVELDIELYFK